MVSIRLMRMGGKKRPIYRVVVADSRRFRDGKIIERLGSYDPQPEAPEVKLNLSRVEYWMGKGAQPTDTVRSLIYRARKAVPVPAVS
jgi:small subunit ribosomal protein S16